MFDFSGLIPGLEPIVVEVVDVREREGQSPQVRLGIIADKRVNVHRREVYEAIRREQGK